MKAIPVEELETLSPEIHAAAVRVGCTHVRISAPIWPGPSGEGPEGGQMRLVEYSWCRAILLQDRVVFDEEAPEEFEAVLQRFGMGEEAPSIRPSPAPSIGDESPGVPAPVAAPAIASTAREPVTAYVLTSTKLALESQANDAGLSIGGLLDRIFAQSAAGQ